MRAVGYFRESLERPSTLAEQNKAFLELCKREGFEATATFADTATSNGQAPGFRELVASVRSVDRSPGIVVVPSLAALGADLRDAVVRYFELESLGVRITPMSDGEVTDILDMWASQDRTGRVSDRVRAAMRRKAVKGEVLGRPPYGYRVGSRRRLEVIPEEAVVVRYIYRLYLQEDLGIRLIARRLNEEGIKTRRGANWSMVSIRDILRNRVYLGTYSRFGVKVPGSHTSLVTNDDFRLAQDQLSARRTSHTPRVSSQFMLSGLAHCGYCDNKLIGVSRRQSWKRKDGEKVSNAYRYYQCESRTNQSVCGYHTRRAEELEQDVRQAVSDIAISGRALTGADEAATSEDLHVESERLRSRLRSIDRRLESYLDAAAKGRLSREKMHKLSVGAATDRLAVEDELQAAERMRHENSDPAERALGRGRRLKRLLDQWAALDSVQRNTGLRQVVARITVTDDDVKLILRP